MSNQIKPYVANKIVDNNGNVYNSLTELCNKKGLRRKSVSSEIKRNGYYEKNGNVYRLMVSQSTVNEQESNNNQYNLNSDDYAELIEMRKVKDLPFEKYDISFKHSDKNGGRYAIALFSDAHIEETVDPNSVLGLNKYNVEIAEERIKTYFSNLTRCLIEDRVDDLIFASLGDTISGFIHEELQQSNQQTPLEATFTAQNLIYNGLKFICDNCKHLKSIKFIGLVGNHSRVTKKIQHANGYKMSYEWLMYKNIEKQCKLTKLPIEFYIPESELAILDTQDNKRFIFIHGFQIKSSGNSTVCGIYPALNRLSLKWDKTFHQDKIYLGHFHTCVSMPNAVVNGSIIGFNSYALTNGFSFEKPAQQYEVYKYGEDILLNRKIYCD